MNACRFRSPNTGPRWIHRGRAFPRCHLSGFLRGLRTVTNWKTVIAGPPSGFVHTIPGAGITVLPASRVCRAPQRSPAGRRLDARVLMSSVLRALSVPAENERGPLYMDQALAAVH